jgi:hypothetical protein
MKIIPLNYTVMVCSVSAMIVFSSLTVAESYKCEEDGVVVYSDTRCGPIAQKGGEVQNSYTGGIRPGEQQMLNEALKQAPAAGPAGDSGSDNYGDRIRQQNEARKARGDERRIERDSSSPWR